MTRHAELEKINQNTGNFESDLRLDARLHGAETEDLYRDIRFDPSHLDADWAQQQ